jgi:hypothetical protein
MISLDIWDDTQEGFDGAAIEVGTIEPNGAVVWSQIGTFNNGINWYNNSGILGQPGNRSVGWSQNTEGWITARYTLEGIPQDKRDLVRLRMVFGSNEDNPTNADLNGFAFDNVNIRERDRLVLIENFTNLNRQGYDPSIDYMRNTLGAARPEDFIYLNYHIPDPDDSDILYQDNKSEPQTRANSFGISQTIISAHDGEYLGNFDSWSVDSLDRRSLVDPQFAIDLIIDNGDTVNAAQDSIIIDWTVEALRDIPNPVIVHTLVIEKEILLPDNSLAHNVVKKMLPNAAGSQNESFPSFVAGDFYSSRIEWPMDVNIYDSTELQIVVFVQERTDGGTPGEIYQVVKQDVKGPKTPPDFVTGIDEELKLIADGISIYPNPVQRDLHFLTTDRPGDRFNWKIVDQRGVTLMADNFRFVNGEYTVDTSEVPNGIYYLIIAAEDQPLSYEKLIIMHR